MEYAARLSAGDIARARSFADRLVVDTDSHQSSSRAEADGLVADVADFIRRLGYKPMFDDDRHAFALDFMIEDPRTGLFGIGIECDPPRHPLLVSARAREVWRPFVLGKSIPRLHRIWSRRWITTVKASSAGLRRQLAKRSVEIANERTEGRPGTVGDFGERGRA